MSLNIKKYLQVYDALYACMVFILQKLKELNYGDSCDGLYIYIINIVTFEFKLGTH